jgi:competence protein ComEC
MIPRFGVVASAAAALLVGGCGGAPTSITPSGGDGGFPAAAAAPARSSGSGTPRAGELTVTFIDVGQGDSALIQGPTGTTGLIDGGPPEAGPAVLKALRDARISRIDFLIGSHAHADHIGGLLDVLPSVGAASAYDPGLALGTATQRKYLELLRDCRAQVRKARAGQTLDMGGNCKLQIVAPSEPLIRADKGDANNNSIVFRLVYGATRFLFTGDMEEEERERLLQSGADVRSNVLKVAHHGSHNGTDAKFLKAVAPEYAVISCGKGNDYKHPHQEALAALSQRRCKVLRTDQVGTIGFGSDGKTLRLLKAAATAGGKPAARFIGNKTSHVFHAASCGSVPEGTNRVEFNTAAAARKAGYRPHKVCAQ